MVINEYTIQPNAYLCGANLRNADLCNADLHDAALCNADLRGAYLCGATLRNADLCNADLCGTNLWQTDFWHSNLLNTVLDPNNKCNIPYEFGNNEIVVGYRTRKCPHIIEYIDGRIYSADIFSTSADECHPGLYLWPTKIEGTDHGWVKNTDIIRVETNLKDIHKAGTKFRARWFRVIGKA